MKVAIVGAGICGLYLAWKLAEKGHQVTIFEKRGKIGKEACSGLFSERILDFIPESQKLIQNQINCCLIHFPKKKLKIRLGKRFFVMSHFELDNLVAKLAEKSGAKIILNRNVTGFDPVIFPVIFHPVIFQEKFDRVVGCDGALSQLRKDLGLKEPQFRLGIQGFFPQANFSDFIETWPTKNGFFWKIPRGKETEYGIIEKPEKANSFFEKFLRENNLKLGNLKSALIPQAPTLKFWWWGQGLIIPKNSSITLCGDAAGLTKPWSGGGVIWGLIAANLLLKNFPDFLKYQKAVKKFFLPKVIFSKITTKMVYSLGFNFPWILPENIKIEGDFLI